MTPAPYFIYPAVKALRSGNSTSEESARLRRLIAANLGHIPSLRILLGVDPEDFASFYPKITGKTHSTSDTIDSFLSNYGNPSTPLPKAAAQIPQVPEKSQPQRAEKPQPSVAEANRLIKNHEYPAALQIIQQLSLINPEKSIYFADQIRFLKKLIFIESKKTY